MESGRQWYGRFLFGLVNLIALSVAIFLPIGYASQHAVATDLVYLPLAAVLPTTIICASVPVLTAVSLLRKLRHRAGRSDSR